MPLGPSLVYPALPHPCRISPDFIASSFLVPGTVTAHTSHFWSAMLSFLPCFHVVSSPNSRSIVPSISISLLPTTLLQGTPLQLFLLPPLFALPSTPPTPNFHCTHSSISSATPVMSQVLQPLPHIHLVPIHQDPSPNFTCN